MSTQKPWVSHLTPQDLFQPFPFCIYNSLLTARNPQGICLYSLSHLCMSPVPQMHWPKAWPVTMSPWNSQILSPVLRGLLINNDLTGMTRNNTFWVNSAHLCHCLDSGSGKNHKVYFSCCCLAEWTFSSLPWQWPLLMWNFFSPCPLLSTSLITHGTVKGWPESIQRCGALQAFPRKNAL